MFKKTLLALAIAGTAFSASALELDAGSAVNLTGTKAQVISAEGAASSASITLPAVTATIDDATGFGTAAKIQVTITGGTLTPSTSLTAVHTAGNAVTGGTLSYPSLTQAVLTLGGTGLTAVQGSVDTNTLVIGGLVIAPTSTAAGSKVTYKVEVLSSVGGAVIDSVTGTVAEFATQFGASVTNKFGTAGAVDVGNARLTFAGAVKTDSLAVTATSAKVDMLPAVATTEKATTVTTGSFGFLDGDADGKIDTGATNATINAAFTTATVTGAATTFDGTAAQTSVVTTTVTLDGKTHVLAPQTFSTDVSFDYVDAASKAATFTKSMAGGSWVLNGDSAYIPFMPFSSAFAQSITISNTGTVAGAITVDITANGVTTSYPLVAVAAANKVTNITPEVVALVAAAGITGDAAINVVTNSPSGDITVSALYYSKSDKDRGIVSVVNN